MRAFPFSREKAEPLREGARVRVKLRGGHSVVGTLVARSADRVGLRLEGGRVTSLLTQDVVAITPLRGRR